MMKSMCVGVGCLLVAAGHAGAQVGVLDQVSPFFAPPGSQTSIFNVDATFLIWHAQVRAGMDGQLEGVLLGLEQAVGGSATVRIRSGDVFSPGPVLSTDTVVHSIPALELVFVDLMSAGIFLNTGDTFLIELQGHGNGLWMRGTYVQPPGTPMYPEPLYLNGTPQGDGNWRIGFETYMVAGSSCAADLSGSSDPNDPLYGVPDGSVDAADFFYFLDQFVAGNVGVADISGSSDPNDPNYGVPDGQIDAADFFYFLDIFVAGCP
ncbi:MAG: hypothetical protein KF866_09975 [Phycisphaeraceae bacterium]|nr:hypothetical protein [Phycisphaeraceae bacterium]MCW5754827.1 hypothetical protein [Phycisphaeraceae bacterium]